MVHPTEVWLESKYRKASVRAADGAVVPAPEAPSPELKMSTELTQPKPPAYAERPGHGVPSTAEQRAQVVQGLHRVADHPLYNVAQAIPGLGAPLSGIAYASRLSRGMTGDAVLDAVRALPSTAEQRAQVVQGLHRVVDHPLYNVAQAVPGLGTPLSGIAYASHLSRGMTGDAVLDAVSAIPGAGLSRVVPRVLPNLTRGSLVANGMRAGTLAQGAQLVQSAEALAKDLK